METLFAYKVELWVGNLLGKSVNPIWVTPLKLNISPGLVVSTLPPASAARSTITLPGFIDKTWSYKKDAYVDIIHSSNILGVYFITFKINKGAFFPGIKAVDIMISTSLHCFANKACSASINSLVISLLYPAAVPPSSWNNSLILDAGQCYGNHNCN